MGVGFQVPIKNLVSILISTAVKTARVVSLSGLKTLSFPLTGYSYENDSFAPVDKVVYLENLHRILSSSVPERVKYWFKCPNIELLELELTITPILPQFGQPTTTVLVIGRLLPSKINPQDVNQALKPPTALELALRLQRHQKLLNKITRNIRRTLDLDVIWQQTVDSLGKRLNLERCIICPYQPANTKVQVIAEYHQPEQISILDSEYRYIF